MSALARLQPAQGIAAMQAINITAINPLFMLALFGTAALLPRSGCLISMAVASTRCALFALGKLALPAWDGTGDDRR